jgi:hypothetical protein
MESTARSKLGHLAEDLVVGLLVALITGLSSTWWERREIEKHWSTTSHESPVVVEPHIASGSVRGAQPPAPPMPTVEAWDVTSQGDFNIFILSKEYRWKLGSQVEVVDPGQRVVDMAEKMSFLVRQRAMDYGDLIAVGTASCEGKSGEEAARAGRRADQLIAWLREALVRSGDRRKRGFHTLNLGKFSECCDLDSDQTDDQRRIILLAVTRQKAPKSLSQDLHDLLRGQELFGLPRGRYTEFLFDGRREP